MISFRNVTKCYRTHRGEKAVLDNVTCTFPAGHNVGILGHNGAGKSTMLRLISGAEGPDRGRITKSVRVSFPLGFSGTFHPGLSGRQNATFVARIYGEDVGRVVAFVEEFSELGAYFDMPILTYSAGMNAKLAFGISLAIDFDVYLIDEVTEVGDARFRRKCAEVFAERMVRSDIIMVSHNSSTVKAYCDMGAILTGGQIEFYDTIDEAMREYRLLMGIENA
jgi:capsular polysaccharide transport system ATP-binding protein